MANIIALYDACVLYPAPLRDLLMHLAISDLFQAKWSHTIHEEWMRNVLANRPDLTEKQLLRTRDLMNAHTRDCLVTGYEKIIPTLLLPDQDDRHVLAAAIHANASVIVTYNLKDFPPKILEEYNINVQHPDNFIAQLMDFDASAVIDAVKRLRASLKKPAMEAETYLTILEQQALPRTVRKLREYLPLI